MFSPIRIKWIVKDGAYCSPRGQLINKLPSGSTRST